MPTSPAAFSNCHETTNLAEGREKLAKGMQVLIREGSVSKDLSALTPLITEFASPFLSLCTDDRNPLDIREEGHLDYLVRRAIREGAPLAAVYRSASWSAARAFGLRDRGLIAPGFLADFLLLDDLENCAVHTVLSPRPAGHGRYLCRGSHAPAAGRQHHAPATGDRRDLPRPRPRCRHRGNRHYPGQDSDRTSPGQSSLPGWPASRRPGARSPQGVRARAPRRATATSAGAS